MAIICNYKSGFWKWNPIPDGFSTEQGLDLHIENAYIGLRKYLDYIKRDSKTNITDK